MPGLLPPMVLELRAVGSQLFGELKKTNEAVAATATKTKVENGKMQAAFDKTAVAGKGLALGLGAAGIGIAAVSLKMATDFQAKMTLLQTAAGESKANIGKVSDGILNLAGATGTSIDQLSEGMYTIEKSGNRGAAGLNILKAAAEGAKAENVDLSVATNALTSVMMSYHLKAADAVKTQNMMIAGSGLAKTTMQEYAGSLAAVLPTASAAGISFSQVGGAIATLTQHGTSAQEATQELANTIRGLQKPLAPASKMMQQLGLNVVDVSSNLGKRGLTGTIDLITNAIQKKMGPAGLVAVDTFRQSQSAAADANTMLQKMPTSLKDLAKQYQAGTVSQKEWRKELKNMGVGQRQLAQEFAATVNKSRGFNDLLKSGSPAAQTFAGTLNTVMGGATGMNTALMLGGENMKYFKKATEEIGAAGKKSGKDISTWPLVLKNLSVQLSQAGESIAAMGVKIGTVLIPFVSQALKTGEQWVNFLAKNPALLITIASVIGGIVVTAIGAYITQLTIAGVKTVVNFAKMIASAAVWSATHIAMLVRTVAAGAVWLAQTGAQFGAWLAKQAAVIASSVPLWGQYIGMQVSAAAQSASAWVVSTAKTGVAIAKQAAVFIASAAKTVAATGVQTAVTVAAGAKQAAVWVAMSAKTVAAFAAQNAAMIAQKAVMVAGAVATGIAAAAQWALNVAMEANPIGLIILAIAALIGIIILVATHWKQVTAFLTSAWAHVGDFFKTVGNGIANWWNGFWGGLISTAQNIFKGVANFVVDIFNHVIDTINGVISGLNSIAGGIKNLTGGAINFTLGKIPHLPSFDVGGIVPGAMGAPSLAVVHGGEPILSHAMLANRAPIPQQAIDAVNRQQGGGGHQVTIMAQTNATPRQIASSVGWELKRMG